jgi:SAM-dependent methyltransferase
MLERWGPTHGHRGRGGSSLREYWQGLHQGDSLHPLQVVCLPDAPLWLNNHIDEAQRRAFARGLLHCGPVAGTRVLDLGCGNGRWSELLSETGADVVGIDISEHAIRATRNRVGYGAFYVADVIEPGLRDSTFDLIVSVTVLQHLSFPEQVRAFEQLARLLTANGHLLLLENIRDQGPRVFSRSIQGWTRLACHFGLRRTYVAGYAYDVPFSFIQAGIKLSRQIRSVKLGGQQPTLMQPPTRASHAVDPERRAYRYLAYRPLLAVSRLVEGPAEALLPDQWATHAALVFHRS